MRFLFVFLFVAVSLLNATHARPSVAAAAAAAAAASDSREIPPNACTAPDTSVSEGDGVDCGVSGVNVDSRIIGGEEAQPHAWPWQVRVSCNNGTETYMCGGSLVSDKWVITAAHCLHFENSKLKECEVSLGMHNLSKTIGSDPAVVIRRSESAFIHEQYENFGIGYDIALIKLDKAVQFNDNIKPICLPFGLPELQSTSICYATGWGQYDRIRNESATALKQLRMQIHEDYSYCRLGENPFSLHICAGSWDRDEDVCSGDSGGPLACREVDGRWYVRGLASFVPDGCYSVGSFTKVAGFQDWIQEKFSNF